MYILVDAFDNVYVAPMLTASVFTAYGAGEIRIFSILDKENPVEFRGSAPDDLEAAEAWTPIEEWIDD